MRERLRTRGTEYEGERHAERQMRYKSTAAAPKAANAVRYRAVSETLRCFHLLTYISEQNYKQM